ncbi:TetR/AcrR family transcriptional regulator [Nocardiopsis xinjiangensis]|uniref:TetR/AcrR family transcriptional regulator n=1 Tax=Nocardiopsis xinjiangensis TaxID=124285 RepID=UPI000344FD6C|nr:TetR/AcrR family transcriptional regulator [Nocardiopsis xinjiangensis]
MTGKTAQTQPSRSRYSGLDAPERTRRRRQALLETALELFTTQGYTATSVKDLCRRAGLTERYFYESFRDRHACLVQLYDELAAQLLENTTTATRQTGDLDTDQITERALSEFIDHLARDPRRARLILLEVVGVSQELEERRHTVLRSFAELTANVWTQQLAHTNPTPHQHLATIGLVGALNHLLVDWLHRNQQETQTELVQVCTRMFCAVRRQMEQ